MIIVSQDKNTIINFNNITEIIANGTEVVITDDIYKDYGETIGIYKTEERAKEVLKQVMLAYSNFQLARDVDEESKDLAIKLINANYKCFDTYEMPEE